MTQRVLLIEDDADLAKQIVGHLEKAGYETTWWSEGRMLERGTGSAYSLIILDLMLPNAYGLDILKGVRSDADTPVLILSARNDTLEKVRALKLGADDYMTKPFWPEELVERVRARMRRPTLHAEGSLKLGLLCFDLVARSLTVAGNLVELTRVEYNLMLALARRPGAAINRQWLVENVLDPEREGGERTLDVHISRLRKKLGEFSPIETVWGIGYRVREEEPA